MKRIPAILLALVMTASLAACGGTTTVEKKNPVEEKDPVALTLDQKNTEADYLDFTLLKIQTVEKVEPSLYSGAGFESDPGKTYVDVVLDVTNRTGRPISSEDLLTARAVNGEGTKYPCRLYAVETENGANLSSYTDIAPLMTERLHCGIAVPEEETDLTIWMKVRDQVYTCDYTLGRNEANTQILTEGQTLEAEDYAAVTFLGMEYTGDLLPSNTSGFYGHYAVEDPNNVYLAAKFDVTNHQGTAKEQDTFLGAKAVYEGKYTYTGFPVVEDTDGKGFSRYEDIAPLTTRRVVLLIEVPKTVTEKPLALTVTFHGEEYVYSYTP